jgi:hypothetical protein
LQAKAENIIDKAKKSFKIWLSGFLAFWLSGFLAFWLSGFH